MYKLSVVIPCRNEREHISGCVSALLSGTEQALEILVVDGQSTDGTLDVLTKMAAADQRVKVIENPRRITPVALNLGIRAASGDYITILGAHSRPAPDWAERNLVALREHPEAIAVGGVVETIGSTSVGEAIAQAGYADTVVFGAYRRAAFLRHGYFDEELATNQDDEYNLRLISRGERLYFDPTIRTQYFSRSTWRKALNQYWRYGRYKVDVFHKNGRLGSIRQIVPAMWVMFLFLASLTAPVWAAARVITLGVLAVYLSSGIYFQMRRRLYTGTPAVFFVPVCASLHLAYGSGTLWGAVQLLLRSFRPSESVQKPA
jgi:glycosyltransferase involved in cell wall biosynthesis